MTHDDFALKGIHPPKPWPRRNDEETAELLDEATLRVVDEINKGRLPGDRMDGRNVRDLIRAILREVTR